VDYYDSIIVDDGEYADSIESAEGLAGEIAELKKAGELAGGREAA
jgi:hypothetical protein